jgi:tRNA A-37 threonylcarbamoyl transferase component Bud32
MKRTPSEKTYLTHLKNMKRKTIESSFGISGKQGKDGTTFLTVDPSNGHRYAIKLFKNTKSPREIAKEAYMQEMAADYGVAPTVRGVSTSEKFIVMDALKETIVAKAKREKWVSLPPDYKAMLYALCVRLDRAGVVQNDGNPLNLMVDDTGRLYIIDYGFANEISNEMHAKRGSQPNVALTLWDFGRRLKHYKIKNDIQLSILNKYQKNNTFKDETLIAHGEKLLNGVAKPQAKPQANTMPLSVAKSTDKAVVKATSQVSLPMAKLNVKTVIKAKSRRRPTTPPSRTRPSTMHKFGGNSKKISTLKKATFTQHAKPPALTLKERIQMRVDRHNEKKKQSLI